MTQPIIQVDKLSKQYQLGHSSYGYRTLRDAVTSAAQAPFRRLKDRHSKAHRPETIWALKEIDFAVEPGEVIGVIGRNGAGKSTLLKILSRITEPTSGRVALCGRVASLLEVGTGFHPELTGRENIYLNGAILGMTRREIQRKFDEIVAFAEVERFIETPVKRYSSGMYLRLAFAVASHLEPEILVVDEVLAVGDQGFQKRCMGRMKSVSTAGRTVIFVSHNMAAVSALCTRVVCLKNGQISGSGPVAEVVAAYYAADSSLQPSHCRLTAVPRRGTGEARLTGFRVLDDVGCAVDQIPVGSPVQFELAFECRERIRAPGFGIAFNTPDGRRVLRLHSGEMMGLLPQCQRGGHVVCRVDRLMLTPGPYLITLALGNDGVDVVDYIEQCIQFDVVPADVYGTGRLPEQQSSAFIATGSWQCDYR
jgi:lipopolysaccharide transport system ATP-binding protein